jgi:hypothetical protein
LGDEGGVLDDWKGDHCCRNQISIHKLLLG